MYVSLTSVEYIFFDTSHKAMCGQDKLLVFRAFSNIDFKQL